MPTDPILVSHEGKLAKLYPDGHMTTTDGQPITPKPEKPTAKAPKRWHDPYT